MECYSIAEHFDSLVPICTPGWRRVHFSCLSAPLADTILLRVTFVRKQTCSNPSFSYSAERAAKKRGRKKRVKNGRRFLVLTRAAFSLVFSRVFSRHARQIRRQRPTFSILHKTCEGEDTDLQPSAFFLFFTASGAT